MLSMQRTRSLREVPKDPLLTVKKGSNVSNTFYTKKGSFGGEKVEKSEKKDGLSALRTKSLS
jgi:hypothetical protein